MTVDYSHIAPVVIRHDLLAITESPHHAGDYGSSPDAVSKFNAVHDPEEDAKEDCGFESSQSFLNPLSHNN